MKKMFTKYMTQQTKKLQNQALLRLALLLLLLPLTIVVNAGSSHSTHYGKAVLQNATGNGTVYLSTASGSNSGQTGTTGTAGAVGSTSYITWNCGASSGNDSKTYYARGTANDGYYWAGWAKTSTATTYTASSTGNTFTKATSTNQNSPTTSTIYGFFKPVTVTAAPSNVNINATDPSATYNDAAGTVVSFTTANSNKIGDFTTAESGDSRWVISAWTRASASSATFNYKFVGNGSYGTTDRTFTKTVTLTSKGDASSTKTCTLTAKYPNPRVVGGDDVEIYTTYLAADATQANVEKTAVFDIVYGDNSNNFTAAFSDAAGGGTWTVTSITVDQANQKATVTYTFNGNKTDGTHTATLTLTAQNCNGWDDTSAAGSGSASLTVTAYNEVEATNDASVTTTANVTTEYATFAAALAAANATSGATLKLLRNVDLGTITATNNITKAMTIDLNGKELRAAVNATSVGVLTITQAVAVTIKDSKTGGKIINEIARNSEIRTIFVNKAGATLTLESGTIAVNNLGQYASAANADLGVAKYASCTARAIHQIAGTTVNINGGRVEAYGTRSVYGIVQGSSAATNAAGTTVLNITGGEIYAEGPYSIMGVYAYGKVNFSGGTITAHVNTNMVNAYYAANNANNTYNGYGYGIYLYPSANATATSCYAGILNMTGGTINVTNDRTVNANLPSYGVLFGAAAANVSSATAFAADGKSRGQIASATGSITGGEINVTDPTQYSYGVYVAGGYNSYDNTHHTVQIKNCKITSKAYVSAYGVYAYAAINSTNGACYAGDVELTNCDVYAESLNTTTAAAVWVVATSATIFKDGTTANAATWGGEFAVAGKAVINSGKYEAKTKTTSAYAVGTSSRAKTVYDSETTVAANRKPGGNAEAYPTLIIHGGTFKATSTTNTARGVSNGGYCTIDGGTFEAFATTTTAYGLYCLTGKITASGVTISASATGTAYGAMADVGIPTGNTAQTGFAYAGELELNNCNITATARTGTDARGVSVNATNKLHTKAGFHADSTSNKWAAATTATYYRQVFPCTIAGHDSVGVSIAGKATINGCDIKATAETTTAYGVYSTLTSVPASKDSEASPIVNIKNTKFTVKTNGTTTAYGMYAGGPTTIDGCDFTVQPKTTTAYGVFAYDKKTTITNTKFDVKGTATVYGLYANAAIGSTAPGWDFHGEFELGEGNDVTAAATSGNTSYAVYLISAKRNVASGKFAGDYACAGKATINGGKYAATASGTTAYALGVADPAAQGEVTATPELIVNDGKFKGTAGETPYADVSVAGEPGYFVLNGGYYVKDENLDKKLGEGMNKVAVKSGTPEYAEGYRWRITDNMTGEAVCKITQNSTAYASLEEALQVVNASPSSTWTIVMTANYTLSSGDYELPANTTLLIPYNSTQTTINGTTPAWVNKNSSPTPGTPYPYLKLTFASGVNMTVKGKIEASSTTYINQNNWTGRPGGAFGWLQLNEGSSIDLESGAYLFAWGYVTGKGEINAKNGSYVYEDFQMGDWRGGTMGSSVNGNKNGLGSKGVFLLTDYYFQNVECPVTYRPGAQSIAYSGAYMEKSIITVDAQSDPVVMVGTSNAMFLMNTATAGADTWVRKEYDAEKDQLIWTLNSGASLGSFTLKLNTSWMDVNMNTEDYVLPMATNFKIVANEGDINITNDVCFLPGSEAIVKKEANMVVASGKRVFFYDTDDWSSYGGYYHKVGYSPSWKACPRTASKLADAKIEVAGTLNIQGSIYTTAGGGNIFSTRENAGKVKFIAAAPASTEAIADFTGNSGQNKTLCQLVGNGSEGHYVGKALTSAKLKNEDGDYTPTTGAAAGDIYAYMEDPADGVYRWLSVRDNGCFTEIKGANTKEYIHPSDFVAVEANTNGDHAYHNEGSTRYFVNAEAASTSASCVWWEAEPKGIIDGVTYYMANNENFDNYGTYFYWDNSTSYWKTKKVTVTWKNQDGTTLTNGSFGNSYNFNTSPQYFGTNPTWANTSTEKHDWIGWRDEEGNIYEKNATLPVATENVTYIAYFQTSKYQYTITFKNEDDNKVIWAGLLDAGEPARCPVEPTQESTVSTDYTFSNWVGYAQGVTDLATITGPATYTAHYTPSTRQYHVTFYNYDAATILYETDVNYNTRPTYGGVAPFRANTSAYSYEWTGWQQGSTHYGKTDNLALVTGDVYYVATFSQTDLKYQVFFKRQDGSIIDAPFFNYEETPAAFPANPTMASTVSTDYTFDHWSPATLQPVTVDGMTYTAYFSESTRQYTAHFANYDGVSLGVDQTIDYNTTPTYTGATPFHPNDSRNSYEFSGWEWEAGANWEAGSIGVGETFPAIKGDITFTAKFNPVLLQFNVLYVREDGTIILQDKKRWGENTAFPSVSTYEDAMYTYTFDHWSPATVVNPVTQDATYTAYFNQAIKTYSISTIAATPAGYGTISPASVTNIQYGSAVTVNGNTFTVNGTTVTATPTANTAEYTYAFDHWNNVPATVTGNLTNIEAVFTRTVNAVTITWKNGDEVIETDEGVVIGATPSFDGATPTKATDVNFGYTFDGWDDGTNVYASDALPTVSGAVTYTAHYSTTPTVASVTVSGATTYYTTLQAAFDFAADKTEPTITMLKDVSGISSVLTYTNTSKTTVTFDLNGHTISGAKNKLLTLSSGSSTGGTFVIKSSVAGGQIRNVVSSTSAMYCVYLYKGKLKLESGTIYNKNSNSTGGASYAVYVASSRTFTMTGGKLESESKKSVYGVYNYGTTTISGGEIKVTETSGGTASSVFAFTGTTTIKGTVECNITGTTSVYGAFVGGATPASDKGTLYNGKLIIEGGTFNVKANSTGTAYGVYCTGNTRKIDYSTSATYAGNYADAGTAEIKGGVFTVEGKTTYGVGTKAIVSINTAKDADGNATYTAASATPKTTITGGKFELKGTTTKAAVTTTATNDNQLVEGGWYNVDDNLSGYVAPTKSCNYWVLPLEDETYNYEVAEAYKITFMNGTSTLQEGGVRKNATPSYNGATPTKAEDENYTYTFSGWSPAIAPATADATYTAQFDATAKEIGSYLDIVDWSANSVTLNMNGYSSNLSSNKNGWKIKIGETVKDKDDRENDRTLVFSGLSLVPGEKIIIEALDANNTVESRRNYTVPYIITSNTGSSDLSGLSEESVLYVKSGKLTIEDNTTVNKAIVNAGAELVIGDGVSLTTGHLRLRTEAFSSAVLTNNGTLNISTGGQMYYSRIVKTNSEAYPIGFPFDVNLNNVKFSNGSTALHGSHYALMEYDAQARADYGIGGNWNRTTSTTMSKNKGYELLSTSKYYYEIMFPVNPVGNAKAPSDDAEVAVVNYSGPAAVYDQGWNYIASPYMSTFINKLSNNPEEFIKIMVQRPFSDTYYQTPLENLNPATPFYYQAVAGETKLVFSSENVHAAHAPRRTNDSNASVQTQWIRLWYGGVAAGTSQTTWDQTSIYLHPTKFTSQYERGYDVIKMSKTADIPLIYSSLECGDLAFAAIPDQLAQQSIPLTVYNPANGMMTFTLDNNDYLTRLESVYLIDGLTGDQTDLLQDSYEYFAPQGTLTGRFFLMPVVRNNAGQQTTTDIGQTNANKWNAYGHERTITVVGLNNSDMLRCYDATGKLIATASGDEAGNGMLQITVPAEGVYFLKTAGRIQKVIVKR